MIKNQGDIRAIKHFTRSIQRGKHWYLALLESIRLWNSTEEFFNERHFKYLVDKEAFDWLLLAERICLEALDKIPEEELINLLLYDKPPVELTNEQFKNLIGDAKYNAYLNYAYGVLIEESLFWAVVEEIRKDRRSIGNNGDDGVYEKAYRMIYGDSIEALLAKFCREKFHRQRKRFSLEDMKEFLYWLFKYRVKHSDGSRVASDTKKAIKFLHKIMIHRKALGQLS